MPCWAREADLSSSEDVARLRVLARRLRLSRQHEIISAGSCDRCGSVIKDDVLVRGGGEWVGPRDAAGVTCGTSCSVISTR